MGPVKPNAVDFWAKVEKRDGPNGCWVWTGARSHGYGTLGARGKAHRHSYELANGPIPAGLDILHSCDNPPCVNPAHLRAGTAKDNARDAKERGRLVIPVGEHNGKSKLTRDAVIEIRNTPATAREMAEKFNVAVVTVHGIRAGHTWAECGNIDSAALRAVDRRKHKARGEAHPKARLTWDSVAEIRRAFDAGESKKGLARRFKVSPCTIKAVVSLRTWHADRRPADRLVRSLSVELEEVASAKDEATVIEVGAL